MHLRDMVGRGGEAFSSRGLHYASSLRGTRQYWFQQRSRLIAMVDMLGLPTVFFTHSAADLQWPELTRLLCPEDSEIQLSLTGFHERIMKFVDAFHSVYLASRIIG